MVKEALRYLGASGADDALRLRVQEIADELRREITPRWVWRVLEAGELSLPGDTARRMLEGCDRAVLLCCTLGAEFDGMLRRTQLTDMARAAILDACGSACVEQACDAAEGEIAARLPGVYLTDRFSPGYGDLPLTLQTRICTLLDASRRVGVTVTDSLLLNPCKTVTAVIGLAGTPRPARIRGCAYCNMKETCTLRKGGKRCV